jgi:hypothetical protein
MPGLAEVIRRYGPEYISQFDRSILPSHRRALSDITRCRTEALGGHISQCTRCGYRQYVYHSCRNRSCTTCHGTDTQAWLDNRRAELVPTRYFHLVFTLPRELHPVVRAHQKTLYSILIRAAALSLMELAADPHYVGGTIALLCVLHTWTAAMRFHPHVHCLVPAGGLSPDGSSWLPARENYLVPVHALSPLFRAKFMHLARRALPHQPFPKEVWEKQWIVYCKPTVQGTDTVLTYLARYVHRIAITDNRIVSIDNGTVTFRYKDSRNARWNTMTLPASQFIRRFLQHVLPRGFHKVRYYGLLSPSRRHQLEQIKPLVPTDQPQPEPQDPDSRNASGTPSPKKTRESVIPCPVCSVGFMLVIEVFSPRWSSPRPDPGTWSKDHFCRPRRRAPP